MAKVIRETKATLRAQRDALQKRVDAEETARLRVEQSMQEMRRLVTEPEKLPQVVTLKAELDRTRNELGDAIRERNAALDDVRDASAVIRRQNRQMLEHDRRLGSFIRGGIGALYAEIEIARHSAIDGEPTNG